MITGGWFIFTSCTREHVKNSLSEQKLSGHVKTLTETTYRTDSLGNIADSIVLEKIYYRYDPDGNKIEEIRYRSDNTSDVITYKYDAKGRKIEKRWRDEDNYLDQIETFRYNRKGNNTEKLWSKPGGRLLRKMTIRYDQKGNKIGEVRISFADSTHERITFRYDSLRNIIEAFSYSTDDSILHHYRYSYLDFDHEGNWQKKVQKEKQNYESVTIRTIEYY